MKRTLKKHINRTFGAPDDWPLDVPVPPAEAEAVGVLGRTGRLLKLFGGIPGAWTLVKGAVTVTLFECTGFSTADQIGLALVPLIFVFIAAFAPSIIVAVLGRLISPTFRLRWYHLMLAIFWTGLVEKFIALRGDPPCSL